MVQGVKLEQIVDSLIYRGSFSYNGAELSLDSYTDAQGLDTDWIYLLAREIEQKRKQLNIGLLPSQAINPVRLYRATPKNHRLKQTTNRPYLSHTNRFALVELIEKNPQRYYSDEGYIQVARDLRDETGSAANLCHIWSDSKNYREILRWSGRTDLPLDDFDVLERLLRDDLQREEGLRLYEGDKGYIQVARDLRDETGSEAHLGPIWSGSRRHRTKLGWPGRIELPLDHFDTLGRLLKNDLKREKGSRRYERYDGYIQAGRDLKYETGSAAHLGPIWSAAKNYREELGWPCVINHPLTYFD